MSRVLFSSDRIEFTAWRQDDLKDLMMLCADEQVMRYFPSPLDRDGTQALLDRLQQHYDDYGYTYYRLLSRESGEFLGFCGMLYQSGHVVLDDNTDIGWRLMAHTWRQGLATEAARRCLQVAADHDLGLIDAVTVKDNLGSLAVMKKIGMYFVKEFHHPKLEGSGLNPCLLYQIQLS